MQEFKASDGNGCAKLVRLVIAESREAWHLLMQVGAASADGVPAAMVRRLDALDAAIDAGFPQRWISCARASTNRAAMPSLWPGP